MWTAPDSSTTPCPVSPARTAAISKGLSTGVRRQAVHKKFDMENGHGALVRMLLHLMPALSITHRDGTDSKEPPRLN